MMSKCSVNIIRVEKQLGANSSCCTCTSTTWPDVHRDNATAQDWQNANFVDAVPMHTGSGVQAASFKHGSASAEQQQRNPEIMRTHLHEAYLEVSNNQAGPDIGPK